MLSFKGPCVQGEDLLSIDAHLKVLQCQYQKMQPDTMVVHNRMQQTFAWRQKEIANGMPVEDVLKKYPFLGMPTGVSQKAELNLEIAVTFNMFIVVYFICP